MMAALKNDVLLRMPGYDVLPLLGKEASWSTI
jgi:hypothetical protein